VIVDNLYIERIATMPAKANAPPIVDSDAVSTSAAALQGLETISWGHPQIVESSRLVQVLKLPARDPLEGAKPANGAVIEQGLRLPAIE
jgi:hypothetical protein